MIIQKDQELMHLPNRNRDTQEVTRELRKGAKENVPDKQQSVCVCRVYWKVIYIRL